MMGTKLRAQSRFQDKKTLDDPRALKVIKRNSGHAGLLLAALVAQGWELREGGHDREQGYGQEFGGQVPQKFKYSAVSTSQLYDFKRPRFRPAPIKGLEGWVLAQLDTLIREFQGPAYWRKYAPASAFSGRFGTIFAR